MNRGLPPLWLSCIPLLLLVLLIVCVVRVFGDETLGGASQIALIVTSGFCVSVGLLRRQITWEDFEQALAEKVSGVSQALFILLMIGALGGTWMLSGVVPFFIYYGMEVMNPHWFLLAACLICAIISVLTGSSWTTIATIGVALAGIGRTMGIDEGWIGGAIISGAYFGDKISPLSDTTVLASSSSGTPLFEHIRYMLYTTIPTFLITLLIFAIVGLGQSEMDYETVRQVQQGLSSTFCLTPWLLAVPLLTCVMIAKRLPSFAVLFLATLLGALVALVAQGGLLDEVAGTAWSGAARRFRGVWLAVFGSTHIQTGLPSLDALVSTRGMAGMMDTIWLILCAMLFGASMTATRMLQRIMQSVINLVRGTISLVASTSFFGFFLNLICADQYLSIILTTQAFREVYQRKGYESRLLSRTCEDSVTVTSVLVPWNTCGMTQSTVLGISTLLYAPCCIFCYLSPLVTILVAAMGWKIRRTTDR